MWVRRAVMQGRLQHRASDFRSISYVSNTVANGSAILLPITMPMSNVRSAARFPLQDQEFFLRGTPAIPKRTRR
jgi:hypothetical protein